MTRWQKTNQSSDIKSGIHKQPNFCEEIPPLNEKKERESSVDLSAPCFRKPATDAGNLSSGNKYLKAHRRCSMFSQGLCYFKWTYSPHFQAAEAWKTPRWSVWIATVFSPIIFLRYNKLPFKSFKLYKLWKSTVLINKWSAVPSIRCILQTMTSFCFS